MLTYDAFLRHVKNKNYILIKLNDEWPFFEEKIFVSDKKTKADSNYHIADGMFSTYINYKIPDNGISAEISGPIAFEISGHYDCHIYVMNCGKKLKEIKVRTFETSTWSLKPGIVATIYPQHAVCAEENTFQEIKLQKTNPEMLLTQKEINSLLQ